MLRFVLAFIVMFAVAACSLPPERPITKAELFKTGIYQNFKIKESPESVLAALNRDGEVVLDTTYKNQPLYVKIMATSRGLQLVYVDK
jgi:hypothetical protein